eukprot:TRINITY_DN1839_c1_g1_i6.p2 TRINITY_DN1839_c1_g1~~TRINITY_DN1839_c1_g1_i6.p2  ORF type:complete len:428 (+),score=169.96 TRINITY_DN1839_c1_g1_i6:111-1394(+)
MPSAAHADLAHFSSAVQEQAETLNRALRRLRETAAAAQAAAAQHVDAFKQGSAERVTTARAVLTAEQQRAAAAAEACYQRCSEIMREAAAKVQELLPALQRIADGAFIPEQRKRFAEQLRAASENISHLVATARALLAAKCSVVAVRAAEARAHAGERAVVVYSTVSGRAAEARAHVGERAVGAYTAVSEYTAEARAAAAARAEELRGKAAGARAAAGERLAEAQAQVAGKAAEVHAQVVDKATAVQAQVGDRAQGVCSAVAERTAGTRAAVGDAAAAARESVLEQIRALEALAQSLLRHAEAAVSPRVQVAREKAGQWSSPYITRAIELKDHAAQQVAQWSPDTAAQLDAAYSAATAGELREASKLPLLLYAAMRCAASAALGREASADESQSDCGATDDETPPQEEEEERSASPVAAEQEAVAAH